MNLLAAWVTLKQLHGRPKLGMVAIELYTSGYLTTVTVAQQHTKANTLPLTATHSNVKQQVNMTQAPSLQLAIHCCTCTTSCTTKPDTFMMLLGS
jgi:hypothetical protein